MADEKHVNVVKRGNVTWNEWRNTNPGIAPDLSGMDFRDGPNCEGMNFRGVDLSGATLTGAKHSDFEGAKLTGARLVRADLRNTNLRQADLSGADLTEAELGSTSWGGARVNRKTKLDRVRFDPGHPVMNDGSQAIQWPRRDAWLHWGIIRRLGALPLFEVSYVALIAAILVITGIGYLNSSRFMDVIEYPIPMPDRMRALLYSSLILFLGSFIYRIACPDRVREFSETQWVEQHGRARLLYRKEAIRRPFWQVLAAVGLFVGAAWGGWLLLERVSVAVRYLLSG